MAVAMQQLFSKKFNLENRIITYCRIRNNSVWINGKELLSSDPTEELPAFLSRLYKHLDLSYPKFFKMDKLCKLGLLATELVTREIPDFNTLPKNEIALIFSNHASSLDSDRTHAKAIADKENYFPSPSVFVYTLPNIVIGEIAIKHKITGENAFFVSDAFDSVLMANYTEILLSTKQTSLAICGWVNVDGNNAEAFVYCLKNGNFKQEIKDTTALNTPQNIQHLYSL